MVGVTFWGQVTELKELWAEAKDILAELYVILELELAKRKPVTDA